MINENNTTENKGDITITFGKNSPPHIGHFAQKEFAEDYARRNGMEFRVYTSKRHMKKLKTPRPYPETPLSPEQKAKHLPRILGVKQVYFAESPYSTIDELHAAGYSRVHVILGSDRMEDTAPGLIARYGDRIVPVQFGEKRSEGKKGLAGASSTKMREHARTNNFQAFKEMLPGHVPEEHAREMFDDVRGGLKKAKVDLIENKNYKYSRKEPLFSSLQHALDHWGLVHVGDGKYRHFTGAGHIFDENELRFMQHYGVMQDPSVADDYEPINKLQEEVSAQTRIKLSRIAKRTSKIRALKRKARLKRRRNTKQLKKRAKQDVKNSLRRRMYKGKWSKVGFSQRAQIDKNINRRKKIADSMVKRIFPEVLQGETKRLQRLNTRKESIENIILPILLEAVKGSRKVRSGKTGANSAKSRISARGRKQKQRAKEAQELAQGNISGKYAIVKASSGRYSGRTMIVDKDSYNPKVHQVIVDPKKFNLAAGQRYLDDNDFIQTDSSIDLYGNIQGEDKASLKKSKGKSSGPVQFKDKKKSKTRVEKARESLMPKKPGKWDLEQGSIEPKRKQSRHCAEPTSHDAKIVEPAMAVFANIQNGISPEEQVKRGLVDESTMMAIIKNPHKSLHPAATRMGQALVEKYGSGVYFKVTGKKLEGTKLSEQAKKDGIVDTTPKTDVQIIDSKTNKVVDNASVKCGPSQAASGNWQDSYSAINWTLNNAENFGVNLSKQTRKDLKDIADFVSGSEYAGYEKTKRGPSGLYTVGGELEGKEAGVTKKEKSNKKLTQMLDKAFKNSPDALALYTLTQMMGLHKFEEGNDAIARSMIAVSHDGNQVKIAPITLDLARKCKIDIASRIKSNSAASKQQEEEWDQLQEQAKKSGKKLTDLDDFRPYSLRNTIRVVINEIALDQLKEYVGPISSLDGVKLLQLILEKTDKIPPPELTDDEKNQNLEEIKSLSENNPIDFFKIILPLFEYDDLSPQTDWLDVLPVDGYTINRVYINGKEHRIPVEKPVDTPVPGMQVSALGEGYIEEKRNYRKEYDNYHGKPEQRKNRAGRVKARRLLMKLGKVRKGDGKDVDHKDGNPRNNGKHNLRVRDKSSNRADND